MRGLIEFSVGPNPLRSPLLGGVRFFAVEKRQNSELLTRRWLHASQERDQVHVHRAADDLIRRLQALLAVGVFGDDGGEIDFETF